MTEICFLMSADTAEFLRTLNYNKSDMVVVSTFKRIKYGADHNKMLRRTVIDIATSDLTKEAELITAFAEIVPEDSMATVTYLSTTPRDFSKALRETWKELIDYPERLMDSNIYWKLVSSSMKPECMKKMESGRHIFDLDIDQPVAVQPAVELLTSVRLPLIKVNTRGGAHLLFRIPKGFDFGNLVLKKLEILAKSFGLPAGTEIYSFKKDRMVPVVGTMQGGHLVTFEIIGDWN